jgi:hypothetical protein
MGPSCTGASSVTDARPVRAQQVLAHPADGSLYGHPIRGRPYPESDRMSEDLLTSYKPTKVDRWILTAVPERPADRLHEAR